MDPVDSMDSTDSIKSMDSMDPMGSKESLDSLDSMDSMDSFDSMVFSGCLCRGGLGQARHAESAVLIIVIASPTTLVDSALCVCLCVIQWTQWIERIHWISVTSMDSVVSID